MTEYRIHSARLYLKKRNCVIQVVRVVCGFEFEVNEMAVIAIT